jgi:DNA-binding IclR family transcriptional regulator
MKSERKGEPVYRVQALERALDILDSFTFQDREMTLSDLVRKTGLNKSTVKRLISNLTARGYLKKGPENKRYHLGMRLFELGGIVFSSFSLSKAAAHPMNRLQVESGATVLLGVRMEDQLVYVDKREGKGMIRISSDIGWRRPLHYGMLGMVLMAFLDKKEVRNLLQENPLEAYTPYALTHTRDFRLRLEEIRSQGYIVEREEAVEGVIGIAAPVKDYSRKVIAALGIAMPLPEVNRNEGPSEGVLVNLVRNATEEISSELGYLRS